MSWQFVRDSAEQFLLTLWHVLPWLALMGVVFSVLSLVTPCNKGKHWWQKDGLVTDFAYWIFVPVFTRYLRIWLTVMGTMLLFHITDGQAITVSYHGDWLDWGVALAAQDGPGSVRGLLGSHRGPGTDF